MSRLTEFTTASTDHQRRRLAEELQLLPRVATRELKEQWQKLIGSPPPGGLSRDLLMRVIANQLQEATLGGLLPRVKRKLAALAGNAENDPKGLGAHPDGAPQARLQTRADVARSDTQCLGAGRRLRASGPPLRIAEPDRWCGDWGALVGSPLLWVG
jgi:hypothetical protein